METKHLEQLMLFPMMDNPSMSSSAERHAKASASPALKKASVVSQESPSNTSDSCTNWLRTKGYDGSSTKMCQTCCHAENPKGATTRRFFRLSQDGTLIRPGMDGETRESFLPLQTETSESHTAYSMYNIPEWTGFPKQFLKDEGVSSLVDVLVLGNVPLRYYLSSVACLGINHRSEKRNKQLPERLEQALAEMTEFMLPMEAWLKQKTKAEQEQIKAMMLVAAATLMARETAA